MTFFVLAIALAAVFSIAYLPFLSWRRSMIQIGRWRNWKEVRKDLEQGNGILYIDEYGKGMTIWWLPKFNCEEEFDAKTNQNCLSLPTDDGFATYCPFWLRVDFIFRRRFPKSKLIRSGVYSSFT